MARPLTVPEFRELGFQVYVKHLRRWTFVLESEIPRELLTLREATAVLELADEEPRPAPMLGRWVLEPCGGRTVAVIQRYKQAEVLASGQAITNEVDYYNRRTGLVKALGRAQSELERKGLLDGA